jgi:erythromycin 3''-O-methyltransferase
METAHWNQADSITWSRRLRELRQALALSISPSRARADLIYELASFDNYLTERTLYRNVGYWKNGETDLDTASEALVHAAGESLQLNESDRLLDVGFGYGDQDLYLLEHFKPRNITGINITRSQLEFATKRVAQKGLSDRIHYQRASATAIPFEDNSFDKVLALECSFHFQTRLDFFREAFRVLRPGGRLMTFDLLFLPYDHLAFVPRMLSHVGLHFGKVCSENVHDKHGYAAKLREAGFSVQVDSVYDDTMVPFSKYTIAKLSDPAFLRKMNLLVAVLLWTPAEIVLTNPWGMMQMDYVRAIADKPAQ